MLIGKRSFGFAQDDRIENRSSHISQSIIAVGIEAKVHLIINKTIDPKGMLISVTFTEIESGVSILSSALAR